MQKIMTRQQVRDYDKFAIEQMGVPGIILMENAGKNCADIIMDHLEQARASKVCIFCGTGNNGGDGYVIARHLENAGYKTLTIIIGDTDKIQGDALINLNIIIRMGLEITNISADYEDIKSFAENCDLIIDAIFGTGLQGSLSPEYISIINQINESEKEIIAVDIPSGLDCDRGLPLGSAIKAVKTVTFVALKEGFSNIKAKKHTGLVYVAPIGIYI